MTAELSGFVVRIDGLAETESGKPLPEYLILDRYGRGRDGFAPDISLATQFDRLPYVERWLSENPHWAARAKIVHVKTGMVVRP